MSKIICAFDDNYEDAYESGQNEIKTSQQSTDFPDAKIHAFINQLNTNQLQELKTSTCLTVLDQVLLGLKDNLLTPTQLSIARKIKTKERFATAASIPGLLIQKFPNELLQLIVQYMFNLHDTAERWVAFDQYCRSNDADSLMMMNVWFDYSNTFKYWLKPKNTEETAVIQLYNPNTFQQQIQKELKESENKDYLLAYDSEFSADESETNTSESSEDDSTDDSLSQRQAHSKIKIHYRNILLLVSRKSRLLSIFDRKRNNEKPIHVKR
jgi:hypothetical protein